MIRLPVLVALSILLTAPAALAREIKSQPEAIKLTPAEAVKAVTAKEGEKIKAILINFDEAHPLYRIIFSKGQAVVVDATNGKVLNTKKRGEEEDDDDDDD